MKRTSPMIMWSTTALLWCFMLTVSAVTETDPSDVHAHAHGRVRRLTVPDFGLRTELDIYFAFDYGFVPELMDGELREPTQEEVHTLMNNTERFFTDYLSIRSNTPTIVDWTFDSIAILSNRQTIRNATLRFECDATVQYRLNDDYNSNDLNEMEVLISMENADYDDYIVNYVRNTSHEDIFYDAQQVVFTGV